MTAMDIQTSNTIIDRIGGTSETARLCDVKPPSVSDWRKYGIPKAQLKYLRLARPEVFEGLQTDEEGNKRPDVDQAPSELPAPH